MTVHWSVRVWYRGDAAPETLLAIEQKLASHDGTAARVPGQGFTVTLFTDSCGPAEAAVAATQLTASIVPSPPYSIEAMDEASFLEQSEAPTLPELVSAPEVAAILEVSRQRVHQLQHSPGFPAPLARLRTGPVWNARAIRSFARSWDRKPGRPTVTTTALQARASRHTAKR